MDGPHSSGDRVWGSNPSHNKVFFLGSFLLSPSFPTMWTSLSQKLSLPFNSGFRAVYKGGKKALTWKNPYSAICGNETQKYVRCIWKLSFGLFFSNEVPSSDFVGKIIILKLSLRERPRVSSETSSEECKLDAGCIFPQNHGGEIWCRIFFCSSHSHMHTHLHTHTHAFLHSHLFIHTHSFTYTLSHTLLHLYILTMHKHSHIHTHTHPLHSYPHMHK